jgi:hypothetical protein
MSFLRPRTGALPVVVMGAAIAFALSAEGCDDRACLEWSASLGACPSQGDARMYFGECSDVTAVLSGPSFIDDDGGLCCYDVKHTDAHVIHCSDETSTNGGPNDGASFSGSSETSTSEPSTRSFPTTGTTSTTTTTDGSGGQTGN